MLVLLLKTRLSKTMFDKIIDRLHKLHHRKLDWPAGHLPGKSFAVSSCPMPTIPTKTTADKRIMLTLSTNTNLPNIIFSRFPQLTRFQKQDYSGNQNYPDLFIFTAHDLPADIEDELIYWLIAEDWNVVKPEQLDCKSFSVSTVNADNNKQTSSSSSDRAYFYCSNTGATFIVPPDMDGLESNDEIDMSYPAGFSFSVPKSQLEVARQYLLQKGWLQRFN